MSYSKEDIKAVTFVKGAIHSPQDVRHYMEIGTPGHLVTATIQGTEVASSTRALKVKEVGRGVYDAVLYFPRDDVALANLTPTDKSTHCPLKGDTTYFDVKANEAIYNEAAWSYTSTIAESAILKDLVAFDAATVQIVEHTAGKT